MSVCVCVCVCVCVFVCVCMCVCVHVCVCLSLQHTDGLISQPAQRHQAIVTFIEETEQCVLLHGGR